jgi:fatty-acyl-CoA synthase
MDIPLTPLEFMRRTRRLHGHREALVDGDLRLTYAQFFDRCDRFSAVLQSRFGVKPGERVAYVAPNTHAQLESFYAVPQVGAVLVPINYRLTADDFAYIIAHSGAKVVCAHSDYQAMIDGIRERIPQVGHFVALEGKREGWLDYEELIATVVAPGKVAVFERPAILETDLLTINYTSGTTARPKGVMITHRNAYMNVVGTLVHMHMDAGERYLWTLPMFHANGWTFVWTVTAVGGTHVCLRKVDPARIFAELERESITMLCAAPTVLIGIANAPVETRRGNKRTVRVLIGGAAPAAATIERIEEDLGWDVTHIYGLTETAPFITFSEPCPERAALSPEDRRIHKARQGVELLTSGELLVVDEEGREVIHDGETVGEIVVRGNVVMKGYFNDPEATETALRGGYFHTGDAAVVHPDGYVEVRDRIKDVIISGGENISSVEVEGVLLKHSAVLEAAVVGMPDPKWGEAPHAFVILREGKSVSKADLESFTRARLAHFKCPRDYHFITELPKTATGKIQKFVLRGGRPGMARQ